MSKVPVRSQRVMMKLVRMGFDVIGACPDRDNPRFILFFFENTPELQEALHSK